MLCVIAVLSMLAAVAVMPTFAKEEKTAEVHYPVGMYFIHQKGRKALFLLV